MTPIVHDLYCGLGGWSEGFLAEGYRCIGYDIERHDYGSGGYPGELMLADVRSLHGSIMKDAAVIVASPPCQEPSYRAMPWKRAKALNAIGPPHLFIELFNACFRIQREASEAAGHYIPLIVENVRGAEPWVGKARAHFGSFYLWGDVGMVGRKIVALNGPLQIGAYVIPKRAVKCGGSYMMKDDFFHTRHEDRAEKAAIANGQKVPGFRFDGSGKSFQTSSVEQCSKGIPHRTSGHCTNPVENVKVPGLNWSDHGKPGYKPKGFNVTAAQNYRDGVKQSGISGVRDNGKGNKWFQDGAARHGSKSDSRKAASAQIAKIPFPLSLHIARAFKPHQIEAVRTA